MQRSNDAVSGSPGFAYETKREADGTYTVTSPSIPDKEWKAPSEREAIMDATKEVYDLVAQGLL